jgi:hypothetical protein
MIRRMPIAACLVLAVFSPGFARGGEEAPPAAAPADGIEMAEITLDGRTVRGRVVAETEEMIRLESFDGTVGYRKGNVTDLRRFTLSTAAYYEERGDHYHERAWEAEDPPAAFGRARRAYERALAHAREPDLRGRIEAKLASLSAEREEYHAEALRRQELARARQEAELIELEKQLTQEKLLALQRQEQQIRDLAAAYRQVHQELRIALDRLDRIERDIVDLEDDLDDIFIRHSVFLDLKRSHLRLEREVRRLERGLDRRDGP